MPATYCEKCGKTCHGCSDEDIQNKFCSSCKSTGFLNVVPEEYLSLSKNYVDPSLEEEFIEKFIKSSPNFSQECWDKRIAWEERDAHQWELIRNRLQNQSNIPKCPTCGSTNIEKISLTKKAVGGALFGLFSSNIRNTMHCKNCGYKW